ncbi:hypothetical protein NK8_83760 (plasmid) [Caballeronia sp. NK8]|nr:hypothetical protein NK8_83760 [Caballeronia sp. NK8]
MTSNSARRVCRELRLPRRARGHKSAEKIGITPVPMWVRFALAPCETVESFDFDDMAQRLARSVDLARRAGVVKIEKTLWHEENTRLRCFHDMQRFLLSEAGAHWHHQSAKLSCAEEELHPYSAIGKPHREGVASSYTEFMKK